MISTCSLVNSLNCQLDKSVVESKIEKKILKIYNVENLLDFLHICHICKKNELCCNRKLDQH